MLFQEELIRFCQLQLTVHHPHGAKTEEDGAFAADWETWKVGDIINQYIPITY